MRQNGVVLILNSSEVTQALSIREAIAEMERAFRVLASGGAELPQRTQLKVGERGTTLVMPCYAAEEEAEREALMVKVASVFPGNVERGVPTINGAVLVLDPETGAVEALMDGASLTAIRTGAASGLATKLLAKEEARVLAVIGAGGQARAQLEAVCAVRPIEEVRIYSRTTARAEVMAEELAKGNATRIVVVQSAAEAMAGADVVCTATTSSASVFEDGDLEDTVHVNAVGAYRPDLAEVPAATLARAFVVVDSLEAAKEEAGELIQAVANGAMTWEGVAGELGELVRGRIAPPSSGLTVFKSVGLAVQDAFAATAVLVKARKLGLGQAVSWE